MARGRFNFSDVEKEAHRRVTLQYAAAAQRSTLAVLVGLVFLIQLWRWYTNSSQAVNRRLRVSGQASRWNRLRWWLSDDDASFLGAGLGRPDQFILGIVWFSWLFFLSVAGRIDEPFSLARMPQGVLGLPWYKLVSLPDAHAYHLSNRLAVVVISQWPFIPLLIMKRNILARLLGCSRSRLRRHCSVLSRIVFIFFAIHVCVHISGMDPASLRSPRFLAVAAVYLLYCISRRRGLTSMIWFWIEFILLLGLGWLIWSHVSGARLYIGELLIGMTVEYMTQPSTKAFVLQQESEEDRALAQRAINPQAGADESEAQFLILRPISSRDEKPATPKDSPQTEKEDRSTVQKYVTVALVRTWNGWFVSHIINLWNTLKSMVGKKTDYPQNTENKQGTLIMEYASACTPVSEEPRVCSRVEGPFNPLGDRLNDLLRFDADQVIFIAGGLAGFLVYPTFFTYVNAQRKKRDTCNARVVWAGNSKSGTCCAHVRQMFETDAFRDQDAGDAVVTRADEELGGDGEEEDTTMPFKRPESVKQSCSLTETCPHPGLSDVLDRIMRRSPRNSVAVVVMGPVELENETRKALRPWIVHGRDVWWFFETFRSD